MSNKVICPECHVVLEHDRGYLPMHMRGIQRGQLVTGSQVCDLSNTKVVLECKKIEYAAECPNCGTECSIAITEEYPGAFGDRPREAWMTVDCVGCSRDHDGYYCTDPACGLELEERVSVFWRVSDTINERLPKFINDPAKDRNGPKLRPRFQDFATTTAAAEFIETLPDRESGRYAIDEMQPGWYATGDGSGLHDGSEVCVGAQKDLKRLALGDEQHRPQFQVAARHSVQLYDLSAVFEEEPESSEGLCGDPGSGIGCVTPGCTHDDPAKFMPVDHSNDVVLVCSCCNLARSELPFHHEAHDDSARSWDYCQECENAGCDLIDCNVRAAQRAATTTN